MTSLHRKAIIEATIEQLDPFAAALTRALEAGTERPPQPLEPQPETFERPVMLALAHLPDNGPTVPQVVRIKKISEERRAREAYMERMFNASRPRRPATGWFKVTDLADDTCHWPVTDEPPHLFCGSKTTNGAYCRAHFMESMPEHRRAAYAD